MLKKNRFTIYVEEKSFEEMAKFFKENPEGFERWRAGVLLREFLKTPLSRRRHLRKEFEKYELKKTADEWIDLFTNNIELFNEWRLYFLRREIFKSTLSKQARLRAVLNGLEIRMGRFGVGTARYNAIVAEFCEVTLQTFNEVLQGKKTPPKVNNNIVSLPLL